MINVASKDHRGKYNNAHVGLFNMKHPEKFVGKLPVQYKSSLEYFFMRYVDSNPAIVEWGYETLTPIKYLDKSSNPAKVRRYYMDFVCKVRVGSIYKTVWVEIKPHCETMPPRKNSNPKNMLIWIKNQCKWEAARLLAKQKGYEFHIITEKELT